eukprot:Skav223729  [mRNA]  locus=scaffold297:137059:141752:+ [translate_table: standard]
MDQHSSLKSSWLARCNPAGGSEVPKELFKSSSCACSFSCTSSSRRCDAVLDSSMARRATRASAASPASAASVASAHASWFRRLICISCV